jgi:hypothetical protein
MDKWDYKTVKFIPKGFLGGKLDSEEFNNQLTKLGHDGWELISCFDVNQHEGVSREVVAVFKRKIEF